MQLNLQKNILRISQRNLAIGGENNEGNYLRKVKDNLLMCLIWNEEEVLLQLPEEVEEIIG